MMGIEDFVIEQETGGNLQQVISGVLVKSPVEAVKEFVSNSYDADSENVMVDVDERAKTIRVGDDGSGISEKGLNDFMRMGDSDKIMNSISPKGRKRIGKFGIAKVLLEYLGIEYEIDTWCGNSHIVGIERFGKNRTDGLEYNVEESDGSKTGTSLLIKGIRDDWAKRFPLASLKNALTWEVPNQNDFNVFLNGNKLVRKNGKPMQKFYFEDSLPKVGNVSMEVQYFETRPKMSGLLIYVNKRTVGGLKGLDTTKIDRSLKDRLFVNVNADGLQDYISFNRAYIKEDNVAFGELNKWVNAKLLEVKSAIGSSGRVIKRAITLVPIKERMKEAMADLNSVKKARGESTGFGIKGYSSSQLRGERMNHKTEISSKVIGSSGFSKAHIVDRGISVPQAWVDSKTKELLINTGHPWYNSTDTTNPEVLKAHMILGTAFALGWEKYLQDGGSRAEMDKFYSMCSKLLSTDEYINDIKGGAREEGMFVPFRRYSVTDITREHISLACLYELSDVGVLKVHNKSILGSELNDYMKKAIDCRPAFDVVKTYEERRINKRTGKLMSKERVRQKYSSINTDLIRYQDKIPFIFDIGKKKPFFLVRNEDVPRFLGLYSQGALRGRVDMYRHMEMYGELFDKLCGEKGDKGNGFYGLKNLCDISKSSPHEVFKIVSFAQKKGINLPYEESDGVIKYSVTHFRKARENFLMRGKNV